MNVTAFELEGFEPIKRIGGGGFGDVWLTRQTNVDRQVAVKVGHAPIQDETIRLRFDRECKALGRLSGHPNIVDVYTAGSLNDGRPYLVLEYISGGTLWQRLKKSPLSEEELVALGREMAGALNAAHSSGVLHRDLKPENILMRASGAAVLGDFGIARLQDGANTTSAAITASVAYAAPEILSGKRATIASDLYGVGICILAAIIRAVPYVEKSDASIHPIINRVLNESHPPLVERGISDELAVIVDSLLAKEPEERLNDAAEVEERFAALQRRDPATIPQRTAGQPATSIPEPPANPSSPAPSTSNPSEPSQSSAGNLATATPVGEVAELPAIEPAPPRSPASTPLAKPAPLWDSGPESRPELSGSAPSPYGARPTPGTGLNHDTVGPNRNLRYFLAAYLATLAVGAVVLFLAF